MMNPRALIGLLMLLLAGAASWLLLAMRAPNGSTAAVTDPGASSPPPPPVQVAARPAAAGRRSPSSPASLPRNIDEALKQNPQVAKLGPIQRKLVDLRLEFLNRFDACLAGRIKGEHHLLSVYQLHRVDASTREVVSVLITGPTVQDLPDVQRFEDRELLHVCAQQAGVGQLQPIAENDAAGDDVSIPETLELPISRNNYLGGE